MGTPIVCMGLRIRVKTKHELARFRQTNRRLPTHLAQTGPGSRVLAPLDSKAYHLY